MAKKTRSADQRANEVGSAGAPAEDPRANGASAENAIDKNADGGETAEPDLEAELARLLKELSLVQEEMLEVLTAKCDHIADGDLDGINALKQREEALGHRLQACHDQRGALLAMAADEGLPGDTLGSLASSLTADHASDLPVQVKEASARMRLLRHHSLANWVLTQRSMLHLSQLLDIVTTGGRLKPTYGKEDDSISSGTLVDRAV